MQNRIGLNVVANILGKCWSIISIYIFVPLWINLLGIEGYGVITFYTVLLTILIFADAGLTATLTREYARNNVSPDYKQNLLRTIEFLYLFVCLIIFCGIFFFAENIVNSFLKTETIPLSELICSVRLMGGIIAVYFLYSLYQGGLMGLQKQVCSNVINTLYGLMRSGIVLIPLMFYPSVLVFLWWQLLSIFIFCLFTRFKLYNYIKIDNRSHLQFNYLNLVWRYAAGMMILAIISSLSTQLDKLLVSNLLTLTDFSKYSLASTVGQITLMAALPIGLAFYPELTKLVSLKDEKKIKILYHKFSYIVATISSLITVIVVLYCSEYIYIWTHDYTISDSITFSASVLVIANFFVSLQYGPYFLALANGHTKTNVVLGIFSIIILVISLLYLTPIYGINGAALPFLAINAIVFTILGYLVIRKYMHLEFRVWLLYDSVFPALINIFIAVSLFFVFKQMPQGYYTLLYGLIIFLTSLICCGYFFVRRYPEYRNVRMVKKIFK